ncbi:MAG: class I SAM-dependent methyltransferase family protein [Candidatus Nanoarchaeia archaeon]
MTTLREALKGKIPADELALVPRSYDVVGNILIFSSLKGLKKRESLIATTVLELYKNIKTVAVKSKMHSGLYRTKKIRIIGGAKNRIAEYKENNAIMKFNVETCYFSPRLSTERLRIAKLVKPKESVLVMFSGVAPYPLVIAKNSSAKEVYGVEINPEAHKYALENVKLNKVKNIFLFKGNVRSVVPKLKKKFDRIVMPLPRTAENYLDLALSVAKKGSVIHFYDFEFEHDIDKAVEKVKKHCKKCKILKVIRCGEYSPRKYRVCVDFKII